MEFTLDEKRACVYTLMALADCDGPRNKEEINKLLECNSKLGITINDLLGGVIETARMVGFERNVSVAKSMNIMKKNILEECMGIIMEADGPANEDELGTWWGIQKQLNLPRWQSLKNDR